MVKQVRLYIEGGGDTRATKAAVREGFKRFLRSLDELARDQGGRLDAIPCGPRHAAFRSFQIGLRDHPDALNILLVDAECALLHASPWEHLRLRDKWDRPADASDDHCHLMVEAVEAWLLADADALAEFYGKGFQRSALPGRTNVEEIAKDALIAALNKATDGTQKGRYHKINHGGLLLGRLNPVLVRSRAPHCDRLFTIIAARLQGE